MVAERAHRTVTAKINYKFKGYRLLNLKNELIIIDIQCKLMI